MSHPDQQPFVVQIPHDDSKAMGEFQKFMDALNDETVKYEQKVAQELGVSEYCASLITYLRGRSRWTQGKEDELVSLDKTNQPLPNVLAGEL